MNTVHTTNQAQSHIAQSGNNSPGFVTQRTGNGDFDTGSTYVPANIVASGPSVSIMPASEVPAVEVSETPRSVASIKRAEAKAARIIIKRGGIENVNNILLVVPGHPDTYQIESESEEGTKHTIRLSPDGTHYVCNCPATQSGHVACWHAVTPDVLYRLRAELDDSEVLEASTIVETQVDAVAGDVRFAMPQLISDVDTTDPANYTVATEKSCPECGKNLYRTRTYEKNKGYWPRLHCSGGCDYIRTI